MGRMQRNKGARIERELVHLHEDAGIACKRVPMSGASKTFDRCDLLVLGGRDAGGFSVEVKARAKGAGFKIVTHKIDESAAGYITIDAVKDGRELVGMTWGVYVRLMTLGELPSALDVGRMRSGTSTVCGWLDEHADFLMLRINGTREPWVVMTPEALDRAITRPDL